nr:hypothetical protein [Gilliamella apicola]
MTTHELKIKSEYFMDVARCQKKGHIKIIKGTARGIIVVDREV